MTRPSALRLLLATACILAAAALLPTSALATTATYGASFSVDDVDPWNGVDLSSDQALFPDLTWNESDSAGDKEGFSFADQDFYFGGSIGGATNGHLGLSFEYEAKDGRLDIDYPAVVDIAYPDDETYLAGDTITIRTVNRSTAGSFDFDPGAQDFRAETELAFGASASGEICFVSCSGNINFFPAINEPLRELDVVNTHAGVGEYGNVYDPVGLSAAHIDADLTLHKPDMTLIDPSQSSMRAVSTKSFADIDLDVDAFSRYPFGKSFDYRAASASYDVLDGKVELDATETHSFDFRPVVRVTFAFPRSIAYRVVRVDGTKGATQTGTSATIDAGQSIELDLPSTLTQQFEITPTLSLDNTLRHRLDHGYKVQGAIKILQTTVTVGSFDAFFFEFGGLSFTLGPVYQTTIPFHSISPTLFNQEWAIDFAPHVQAARGFDPENIPVAHAGGPYVVNEGSSIDLDASASFDLDDDDDQVLTYAWVIDGPGSIESTGEFPQFDGLDGPHTYVATVTVCDPSGDCTSASTTVRVDNVVPSHVLDTTSIVGFGGGPAFLARVGVAAPHAANAIDVGTDDTTYAWSTNTTATWQPASTTYLNNGRTPDARPSALGTLPFLTATTTNVTYSIPGYFTTTVLVTDDDGGSTTTSRPVLVADASTTIQPIGWFTQQYSGKGARKLTDVQRAGYLDFVEAGSRVFAEVDPISTDAEAYAVLSRNSAAYSKREQLRAVLLASWLNVASGAVAWGDAAGTLTASEIVALDPAATDAQLNAARKAALAIWG